MKGILRSAERVVLECWACGERTVLGGPEEVWLSGPTAFGCGGSGAISPSPTAASTPSYWKPARGGRPIRPDR